jgi:hypothetical protein
MEGHDGRSRWKVTMEGHDETEVTIIGTEGLYSSLEEAMEESKGKRIIQDGSDRWETSCHSFRALVRARGESKVLR